MRQHLICLMVLMLLALCACGEKQAVIPQEDSAAASQSAQLAPESASVSEPGHAMLPVDFNGISLCFIPPDEDYDILAKTLFGDAYAIVYQREMPDSFNKQYSADDVFYNLSTQLFSSKGEYLKTVDSLRHNSNKLSGDIVRIKPHANTITFECWQENEQGKIEALCLTLAMNEQGMQALANNPNNYWYDQSIFAELACDDDMQLQYVQEYDLAKKQDVLRFRLADRAGEIIEQKVEIFDASFQNALYNSVHGIDEEEWLNDQHNPLYVLSASLDAQTKTAQLSNGKIFCTLSFGGDAPQIEISRSYTKEMLDEEIAASPDKTRKIYAADTRHYFESASGCDYVVCAPDGSIKLLYAGSGFDELYFLDNDRIWVNTFDDMRFYNAITGEVIPAAQGFDLGCQQSPYDETVSGLKRMVLGTAVDEVNRLLLVAHRPYTFGSGTLYMGTEKQTEDLPVSLTVLDWDGNSLWQYDTGMTVRAFSVVFINTVSIKIDGKGTANLSSQRTSPVQVNYMAP